MSAQIEVEPAGSSRSPGEDLARIEADLAALKWQLRRRRNWLRRQMAADLATEQAFRRLKAGTTTWPRHRDAGRLSYMAGLAGALLFMATGIGSGWLGFAVVFLPASAMAAWVVTPHA